MSEEKKFRKGTTTEHSTFTGALAEVTVDTTKKSVVVHDGSTVGGFPLAKEDMSNLSTFVGSNSSNPGAKGLVPAPPATSTSKFLSNDGSWIDVSIGLSVLTKSSTSTTLVLSDKDSYLRFTYVGTKTLVVPTNVEVAFPIGTTISGIVATTGNITISPNSGVTVNTPDGLVLGDTSFSSFVITKVGTNEWDLAGNFGSAGGSSSNPLEVLTKSNASTTLALTDANNYLRFTYSGAKTITVPTNASVAFPIGTIINGVVANTGNITFVPDSGVTINTPDSLVLGTTTFSVFILTKVATDTWDLTGSFAATGGSGSAELTVLSKTLADTTLALTDANGYGRFSYNGAKTLTVPTNDSVAFPIGTTFGGITTTATTLTVVAASGVTINTPTDLIIGPDNLSSFLLTKVGTNEWDLVSSISSIKLVSNYECIITHPTAIALGGYPITLYATQDTTFIKFAGATKPSSSETATVSLYKNGVSVYTANLTSTRAVNVINISVTQGDQLYLNVDSATATLIATAFIV